MIDWFESIWMYVNELGNAHNVNPIVFGILYIGSIPPYLWSMAWIVSSFRRNKSMAVPIISTLFFFILPAMYIAIFGTNVAWWVYLIIVVLLFYGGFTAVKTVQSKIKTASDVPKHPST